MIFSWLYYIITLFLVYKMGGPSTKLTYLFGVDSFEVNDGAHA